MSTRLSICYCLLKCPFDLYGGKRLSSSKHYVFLYLFRIKSFSPICVSVEPISKPFWERSWKQTGENLPHSPPPPILYVLNGHFLTMLTQVTYNTCQVLTLQLEFVFCLLIMTWNCWLQYSMFSCSFRLSYIT